MTDAVVARLENVDEKTLCRNGSVIAQAAPVGALLTTDAVRIGRCRLDWWVRKVLRTHRCAPQGFQQLSFPTQDQVQKFAGAAHSSASAPGPQRRTAF